MTVHVVGISHKRAPIEVRETLAFRREEIPAALADLRRRAGASEAVILSTCNRVELYVVADGAADPSTAVRAFLAESRGADAGRIADRLYDLRGSAAIEHLFRVASGLDSMVFGETQVLAQVKDAYEAARDGGHTSRTLNRVFQRAFRAAKRIHASTSVGEGGVSVPSVAAGLARRVFEDLSRRTLLVVGAGETAELTVAAFKHRGVKWILVANRSPERAGELARRFGGEAHGLDALASLLPKADLVVTCVEAERPVIGVAEAEAAVRARRGDPIVAIDLGVPRNVDPQADRNDNIYLFDIDDLEGLVGRNLIRRESELEKCRVILEEEVRDAAGGFEGDEFRRLAERLEERAARIALEEASRQSRHVPPEEVRRIVKKAVHLALQAEENAEQEVEAAVRRLFSPP